MKKLKNILIVISVLLNLSLFGCQDNDSILGIDNSNNIINPKYFYSGQWEFNGLDTLDNYEFKLNVEFNQDENNEFPKILVNKDSVEINSVSILLSPFVFNGDSSGDSIIIKSNTTFIDSSEIIDSLVSITNGLLKSYVIKIPKDKLEQYSNITDDGILHLVLALYISGGYITNETDYDIINRKLFYATGSAAYFIPLENKLIYANIGLN
ncbi:MAG: hypothetical protein ABIJ40_02635 [Bacteroidota bacterium]